MEIRIPKTALVLLVGASGSGKSSFAKKHFAQYETVSSDACRGIVSNDENNQAASNDAFELFYYIILYYFDAVEKRLTHGCGCDEYSA